MVTSGRDTPLTAEERLLAEFLELAPAERSLGLERLCSQDPGHADVLRRHVRRLEQAGLLAGNAVASRQLPRSLGDFELVRPLGSGNMGVVYLARQVTLQRDVALKLIRPELHLFPGARARFAREVEAVARLQHPGIVPVYAVGESDGIPWFAMELVAGCSLAEVLTQLGSRDPETLTGIDLLRCVDAHSPHEPGAEDRGGRWATGSWVETCLHLVGGVAEALQHAHGRGILHRDVKPSNILVTRTGRACLVDFGLASSEGSERITRTGSPLGSLAYMPPEQLRGETINAHADVYSLGVTLFELLALRLPFVAANLEVLRRMILEGMTPRLRQFNRAVPEDVELVVQAAMAAEGVRRYPTAAAFADDIQRLREHRPIRARRPGLGVRTRRWAQRHPAMAASLVLAGVGLGSLFWQERQAGIAVAAEARRAENAASALARVLGEFDRPLALKEPLALRTQLAAQSAGQDGELLGRYHDAWIRHAAGVAHGKLGQRTRAIQLLREAEQLAATCAPPMERAEMRSNLAILLRRAGEFEEAERLHREVRAIRASGLGADHALTAESEHNLAVVLHDRAQRPDAVALLEHALAVRRRGMPGTAAEVAGTLLALGELQRELGRRDQARRLLQEALALVTTLKEADQEDLASLLQNLAHLELTGGDVRAATLHLGQVVILRRQLGSPALMSAQADLAIAYTQGHAFERAEAQFRDALDAAEVTLDAEHPERATLLDGHGLLLQKLGRHEAAEQQFRAGLKIRRARFGPEHEDTGLSLHNLGHHFVVCGQGSRAEPLLTEALRVLTSRLGPDHAHVATATISLGKARVLLGQADEGVQLIGAGLATRRSTLLADDPAITSALHNLGWALLEAKQIDAARTVMHEVLGRRRSAEDAVDQAVTLNNLGVAEVESGNRTQGAQFLEEALKLRRQHLPPLHPEVVITVENLLWCHFQHESGDLTRAEALGREFLAATTAEANPEEHDRALHSLAKILARRTLWPEAHDLAQRLLELRRRVRPDQAEAIQKAEELLANIQRQNK